MYGDFGHDMKIYKEGWREALLMTFLENARKAVTEVGNKKLSIKGASENYSIPNFMQHYNLTIICVK